MLKQAASCLTTSGLATLALTAAALCIAPAMADDEVADSQAEKIQYKLVVSSYASSDLNAKDINLRAKYGNQTAWLAYYEERPSHFNQARTGYERTDQWPAIKLVSSVQAADYGFLGESITAQLGNAEQGSSLYAILGYSRTNLRPYDNINFDPNDAITLGAGWEQEEGKDIALYRVRDNRVVKGQQIDHLLSHFELSGNKVIVDLFNKSGTPDMDGKSIHATGMALTYEWDKYYVRAAYDPKVNFSQSTMSRLSLGLYF